MKHTSHSQKNNKSNIVSDILLEKPYIAITNSIEVAVWPEFVDKKSSVLGELYIWAYHIRITNKSIHDIKLISRYWRIIDEFGNIQEIKGDGVVGEQPIIATNNSYQYSSGVHLKCSSGIMAGTYKIEDLNNKNLFEIKIPNFSLDTPFNNKIIN